MDRFTLLQHYWWLLISLTGAVLVFLLFVQGGQALLHIAARTPDERTRIVARLGTKWELTFTTLVVFGGSLFASFPLFYSTSFGGACYLWLSILGLFVFQAVAYEFRNKRGNLIGRRGYDLLLTLNGLFGPLLLGTAVGTLFTGGAFSVDRSNLTSEGGDRAISQWHDPWRGLEALGSEALLLGLAVLFLSVALGSHYLQRTSADDLPCRRVRRAGTIAGIGFLLLFAAWFVLLLSGDGMREDPLTGRIVLRAHHYLLNFAEMPAAAGVLGAGALSLLAGIVLGARNDRRAFPFSGAGTVLAVGALLLTAGWNGSAYYPSVFDPQSSLTIRNSSSGLYTLRTMSLVSLLLPVVVAYVACVWHKLAAPDAPGSASERMTGDPEGRPSDRPEEGPVRR